MSITTAARSFYDGGVAQPTESFRMYELVLDGGMQLTKNATAGNVLTSDAKGNATWQAPTGGVSSISPGGGIVITGTASVPIISVNQAGLTVHCATLICTGEVEGNSMGISGNVAMGSITNLGAFTSDPNPTATFYSDGSGNVHVNSLVSATTLSAGGGGQFFVDSSGDVTALGTVNAGSISSDGGLITTDGSGDLNVTGNLNAASAAIGNGGVTVGSGNTGPGAVGIIGATNSSGLSFIPNAGSGFNWLLFAPALPSIRNSWSLDDIKTATGFVVASSRASVTQVTSINTNVTCNGSTGIITTVSSTLGPASSTGFSLINSYFTSAAQVITFTMQYPATGTAGVPYVSIASVVAGSNQINITLSNLHASQALAHPVIIYFSIE